MYVPYCWNLPVPDLWNPLYLVLRTPCTLFWNLLYLIVVTPCTLLLEPPVPVVRRMRPVGRSIPCWERCTGGPAVQCTSGQ